VFPTPKAGDLPEMSPNSEIEFQALEFMPDLKSEFEFSDREIELGSDERSVL